MATDIVGDLDASFSSCFECHSENTNFLSHLVDQELQSKRIFYESVTIVGDTVRNDAPIYTTVLNVRRRFILLSQKGKIWNIDMWINSPPNLAIIDLLENKLTELWYSEVEFESQGLKPSELLIIIPCAGKRIQWINDRLLVFAFGLNRDWNKDSDSLDRWNTDSDNLYRVFLCPIVLDSANKSFHFADLIMLQDQPVEWCGDIELCISRRDEPFQLQSTFVRMHEEQTTKEILNFEAQNDRLIFVDKTSIPNYKRKQNCRHIPEAINGKRYEFKRFWKMSEQLGRRIRATNYSLIRVYDLEQSEERKPQIQHTQCQYNELKGVLDGQSTLRMWHSEGFFVSVFSQTEQCCHIYSFNVALLQWNRIEWLQFSPNHTRLDNSGFFDLCVSTKILHIVSPNTLFLMKQYCVKDTNGQNKSHSNYYRLTVGRPEYLLDLAWSRVQTSIHKDHLRNAPFNKFE